MYRIIDCNNETEDGKFYRVAIVDTKTTKHYLYQILVGSSGGMGWVVNSDGTQAEEMYDIIRWLYRVDDYSIVYAGTKEI